MNVRPAAVAGMFYPASRQQLSADIQHYLDQAIVPDALPAGAPKVIVVPHAGYVYSAPVAASAYRLLEAARRTIKKVVLLGPSHRVGFSGLACSSAEAFETPLGTVPLDVNSCRMLLSHPAVMELDQAHAQEHSLEVQLPFLQAVLDDFEIIPLVVGDTPKDVTADVLNRVWGGDETLIVISSDLSHYHDYQTARSMDSQTSEFIAGLQPEKISYDMACGRAPLIGALDIARRKHLQPYVLDIRNSGDTAGPKDRVVGYGAYAFYPA